MYGRGVTFDSLVKTYCKGIPTRAVLEELLRTRAVEILESQKVKAKSSLVINRGINDQAIKSFGDRATELLWTMLQNMQTPESPRFIATVNQASVPSEALPLIRRELANKATEFLAKIRDDLAQESNCRNHKSNKSISVTVFSCESPNQRMRSPDNSKKRTNYRRIRY